MADLRRYLNKEIYVDLDGEGAVLTKIIKKGDNYYVTINSELRLIHSNGRNRVAFNDNVLERKLRFSKPKV